MAPEGQPPPKPTRESSLSDRGLEHRPLQSRGTALSEDAPGVGEAGLPGRVALLVYNACSMIRHVWPASGPGPWLSRFRATLLCASGHISKHGTQRQLTIYNAGLRKRFRMIHAAFPVSEHATLPRKPKP